MSGHSHSWAGETGTESMTLLQATPKGDGTDGKPGDVIEVETNYCEVLVGSGVAEYTTPPAMQSATGQMFQSGSATPYVPPPAPKSAAAPAKT